MSYNGYMKILHITNCYPTENYSSFGIFIKEQIESLRVLGLENDVYFINAYEKGYKEYIKAVFSLSGKFSSYDIIHCHHAYSGMVYFLSKIKKNKPLVFSNLGDINKQKRYIDRYFFDILSKTADAIIYKNSMNIDGYAKEKFHYIPNGVNMELFRPIDRLKSKQKIELEPNEKEYALFVSASGTKSSIKRYDKFVKTLELLSDKGINLESLVMSGVKRELVPYYFNSASILFITSDHEGSPNAVKEAMACNLPVISTDVGNVAQMLQGCNSSFVAKTNKAEELCELAEKALSIKEHNEREVLINKELDMKSVSNKLKNLYSTIISSRCI